VQKHERLNVQALHNMYRPLLNGWRPTPALSEAAACPCSCSCHCCHLCVVQLFHLKDLQGQQVSLGGYNFDEVGPCCGIIHESCIR
jgi:hypothetical protein